LKLVYFMNLKDVKWHYLKLVLPKVICDENTVNH
jgi:hypothetical protein